jgi:hypothetical protein
MEMTAAAAAISKARYMLGQLWVELPGVGAGVAGAALPLEPLPEELEELDDELEEAA